LNKDNSVGERGLKLMTNNQLNDPKTQDNDKSNGFDVEASIKIYFITFTYEVNIDFDPVKNNYYIDLNASISI
jgi:hypothetical protein